MYKYRWLILYACILHNIKIAISGVMVLLSITACPTNFLSCILSQDCRYPTINRLVFFFHGLLSWPQASSLKPDFSTLSYTLINVLRAKNYFSCGHCIVKDSIMCMWEFPSGSIFKCILFFNRI